jgi:hypothetical protein
LALRTGEYIYKFSLRLKQSVRPTLLQFLFTFDKIYFIRFR